MADHFPPSRIIDVAPLFEPAGDRAALDATVVAVLAANGSFVATGFPGSDDNDDAANRVLSFFTLPQAEKDALAICRAQPSNPNIYRGYYPIRDAESFAYNEVYDIGPDTPGAVPDLEGVDGFREHTPWPAREPFVGWRARTLGYVARAHGLSLAVQRAIARHLGKDEEAFIAPCRNANSTLRLLHYLPPPDDYVPRAEAAHAVREDELGRRILTQRHVDTGVMSILWQEPAAGLQMQGPDGAWRDVPVIAGGLSVHLGDLIKGMTDGLLQGTPHRVTGGLVERSSLGLFVEPDYDALVLAPDSSEPVTYAGHLLNEFPGRFERPKAA